jgi:hypothetical protein
LDAVRRVYEGRDADNKKATGSKIILLARLNRAQIAAKAARKLCALCPLNRRILRRANAFAM